MYVYINLTHRQEESAQKPSLLPAVLTRPTSPPLLVLIPNPMNGTRSPHTSRGAEISSSLCIYIYKILFLLCAHNVCECACVKCGFYTTWRAPMRRSHPSRSVQMENVQPAANPITKTTIQLSKGLCGKYAVRVRALCFLRNNLKNVLRTTSHPSDHHQAEECHQIVLLLLL